MFLKAFVMNNPHIMKLNFDFRVVRFGKKKKRLTRNFNLKVTDLAGYLL